MMWRMCSLKQDGMVEPVSRDQTRRRERGQVQYIIYYSFSPVQLTTKKQDWQPYPVDLYSCYK